MRDPRRCLAIAGRRRCCEDGRAAHLRCTRPPRPHTHAPPQPPHPSPHPSRPGASDTPCRVRQHRTTAPTCHDVAHDVARDARHACEAREFKLQSSALSPGSESEPTLAPTAPSHSHLIDPDEEAVVVASYTCTCVYTDRLLLARTRSRRRGLRPFRLPRRRWRRQGLGRALSTCAMRRSVPCPHLRRASGQHSGSVSPASSVSQNC